jgi:hypothetical protein
VPEEPQQQLLNNVQQMQQVPQLRQLPLPQRQQRNRQP